MSDATAPPAGVVRPLPPESVPGVSEGYRRYVLLVLFLGYVTNNLDRSILSVLIEPIRREFSLSDTQLGLLGGLAFAVFYSTLGIPIASLADRWSRKIVLGLSILTWSAMTALCGAATSFLALVAARIGTASGEAGGSPPSHSLIADYYPLERRATALSIYALGVPIGGMLGNFGGGLINDLHGWRWAFFAAGIPGLIVGALVLLTIKEPPRGGWRAAEDKRPAAPQTPAPTPLQVLRFLWNRRSFRHMSLAAALHAIAVYGAGTFNAAFLIRSHDLSTTEVGAFLSVSAAIATAGVFLGGYLSDRMTKRTGDRRWYMWVPGLATAGAVPFAATGLLAPDLWIVLPCFVVSAVLGSFFFGPSFAVTQANATPRMRAVSASVLLFIQTLIGLGLGPLAAGIISDALEPRFGEDSLRYSLLIIGLTNVWAGLHYLIGGKSFDADARETERLAAAGLDGTERPAAR